MEQFNSIVQLGSAAGVIVSVILFLKYITARDAVEKDTNAAFIQIIQNHMIHENVSFQKMTDAMQEMQNYFKSLNGKIRKKK